MNTALTKAADRLDEAFTEYLEGEPRCGEAWVYARDYRDEGFALAEQAAALDADAREELIDDHLPNRASRPGADLVAAAYRFRLLELDAASTMQEAA